jgi:hypothetical protein
VLPRCTATLAPSLFDRIHLGGQWPPLHPCTTCRSPVRRHPSRFDPSPSLKSRSACVAYVKTAPLASTSHSHMSRGLKRTLCAHRPGPSCSCSRCPLLPSAHNARRYTGTRPTARFRTRRAHELLTWSYSLTAIVSPGFGWPRAFTYPDLCSHDPSSPQSTITCISVLFSHHCHFAVEGA